MSPAALAFGSWLLAAVFARALHHKLTAWPRFRASLAAYRLLPNALTGAGALLLTAAESATVVLLVTLRPEGLIMAAVLLALYFAAMALNLTRGRRQIDCGCGDEPTPLSAGLLTRNALLAALALALYGITPAGVFQPAVLLTGAGLAVAAFALYLAADQLLANQGRHRRLWLEGG